MGLFSRKSEPATQVGWVEQATEGGWDVVFPDGHRISNLASLVAASELALGPVTAGPKYNPPTPGTRSDWMPEGAESDGVAPSGRNMTVGTEVSVYGESGRFIVRWIKDGEVTVYGGSSGHEMWRTFRMEDIKRVHSKPKTRQNVASMHLGHQMADQTAVAHCPFCGSGDVVARSDGSIECIFCSRYFSIREQPQFAATPGEPSDPANMLSAEPSFDDNLPPEADPEALQQAPTFVAPKQQMSEDGKPAAEKKPPFPPAEARLTTRTGARLDEDSYALHLALRHGDRQAILSNREG